MVDGTCMCGACRLTIGGKTKFVCIDGPEFDGALVDWDEMFKRMGTFKREEQEELAHYEEHLDSIEDGKLKIEDDWYSVDGRKLDKQPTRKGVYLNNGRKVVIK